MNEISYLLRKYTETVMSTTHTSVFYKLYRLSYIIQTITHSKTRTIQWGKQGRNELKGNTILVVESIQGNQ